MIQIKESVIQINMNRSKFATISQLHISKHNIKSLQHGKVYNQRKKPSKRASPSKQSRNSSILQSPAIGFGIDFPMSKVIFAKPYNDSIVNWDDSHVQVRFHSGRTDSSGGHTDLLNKSGLGFYHYHHGEGPHLHPHTQSNNAEIWVGGYQTGVKFVGYLDSNENRVYTNQFEEILEAIGSCTSKVKGASLEIREPNIKEPKLLSLKVGYVKVSDLLKATEDACGYYVSKTMTINNIFIVELETNRIKSEILVNGQKVDAYLDTTENRVYTKDFIWLSSYLGGWMSSVVGTDLEISKEGMVYEEPAKISLRGGFVKLVDLLNNIENCCGYYISNTKTVGDIFTVELEVKRLVIWIYGQELHGYIKNNDKYLLLQGLNEFIYYIGSEKDYDLVSIYGSQLRIMGDIQQSIPLPTNNLLNIRDLLVKAKGSVEYDISNSWFWKSKSVDYIAITTKWYIMSNLPIPTKTVPADFGKMLDENAPLNNDIVANVWYNGNSAGEFNHKNGTTYFRNTLNIGNYPFLYDYLRNYQTIEDAISAHNHQEFTSHWYDKRDSTYNIVINTQMNTAPIRLVRKGNQVTINANFKFLGKLGNELFEERNVSYGDVAIDAIKKCWEGRYYEQYSTKEAVWYDKFGTDYVDVHVNINNNSFSKSLDFHIDSEGRGFCPYNIGWNISGNILNGFYCFAFQNWQYYNYEHFQQLAAHEFGHLIGLGDAYKDLPKQHAALWNDETPQKFIMRDTSLDVMPNDIEMALEAFKTNALQIYDPWIAILGKPNVNPFMSSMLILRADSNPDPNPNENDK